MECEFCNSFFSSSYSLKKHQNTAKYCLAKQNKKAPEEHICDSCGSSFTLKSTLNSHLTICKVKKNVDLAVIRQKEVQTEYENKKNLEELLLVIKNLESSLLYEKGTSREYKKDLEYAFQTIEDQKSQIESLQNRLQFLAEKAIERPTNNINNTNIGNTKNSTKTQNLIISDWRTEIIEEKVEENFKLEHIEDGIKGVARFTTKYITHDDQGVKSYQCTDSNREIFVYKDADGVVQKDIKARKLKDAIKEPILKKTAELSTDECHRLMDLMSSSKGKNDDVFEVSNIKMAILTKKAQEIRDIETGAFSKEMVALSV
jgi:hypothetical protein